MESSKDKYERCVLKVKKKQPKGCVQTKAWGKTINGQKCYNPWAVCGKSVRGNLNTGNRKIHIGPRGGKYYLKNGRKVYVK